MSILVIQPGLMTSIQGIGRIGQMHNGVAQSGAMDPTSALLANWLVSNPSNSPLIEITLLGPTLKFELGVSIAITGAKFNLKLNNKSIYNDRTIFIKKGDLLTFGGLQSGARAYLAFSAKLNIPKVLGSYATNITANLGGYKNRALKKNDRISLHKINSPLERELPQEIRYFHSGKYLIRCNPSVETSLFTQNTIEQFLTQKYYISSNSNRMGVRLESAPLNFSPLQQMTSSGLVQGSIQVPASGLPIISSVDGQTIGGYPRIANVASIDLPLIGQLKAGDKISFCMKSKNRTLQYLKLKHALIQQYTETT